jgi:hypothetical protein
MILPRVQWRIDGILCHRLSERLQLLPFIWQSGLTQGFSTVCPCQIRLGSSWELCVNAER